MEEESWVCVDGHGDERIFPYKPYRDFPNMNLEVMWGQRWTTGSIDTKFKEGILLPKGTIKHLIGKTMAYSDEPIKIL
jgi:hypothetical protein